jgi:probable F420-dependent oxidoreductase
VTHEPVTHRPFRFLAEARAAASARQLGETARRAEASGIDVLVFPDHLIDQLAPVPAMTAAAVATTTLRVAPFVLNNDLRHPAVLAQELASLDVLSEGRLEIAVGAGWNRAEYEAVGLAFDRTPVRQARLAEALEVLTGCFAEGPFSFAGEHYRIEAYDARPEPVQRPHPPYFVGGGGRRTLELAARHAQTVGLAPRLLRSPVDGGPVADPASLTFEGTAEKVAWVRAAAGDRFDRIELNVYPSGYPVTVTDDPAPHLEELAATLAARAGTRVTADQLADSPHVLVGPVGALVEKLQRCREELGISSVMVGQVGELDDVVARLAGT